MASLSIIIPAYNEEKRLGVTLREIATARDQGDAGLASLHEVLICDDGSSDRTVEVAEGWRPRLPINVVRLPANRGKGAAVRAGVMQASGDVLLMYDADGATPVSEIAKLMFVLEEQRADLAIGSRVTGAAEGLKSMAMHRRLIGRIYRALCTALIPGIHDAACGCKLFRADAAKTLFSLQRIDRFAFDIEVLALAIRRGMTILELPLKWTAMPESKVRLLRDGPEMFLCLLRLYWSDVVRRSVTKK